jgi:membrane protease YdiL (CAAX protease family)
MLRIGSAMLLFVALFQGLNVILIFVNGITESLMSTKGAKIFNDILYDVVYLFSFLFPAGFFYMISKGKRTEKVLTEPRLGKSYPLMMMVALASVLAAAYINSSIMEIFNYSDFSQQFFVQQDYSENYLIVLSFIGMALVPAFCEEFLFRGVILTNLLPYGKTTAVIASAALFALMHQNGGQIFYTFIAGIALGLIYVRTRSIWGGILLHLVNNLLSVIEELIFARFEETVASSVCTYIEAAIFAAGVVSAVVLIIIAGKKKKKDFSSGAFGVMLEPDENFVERPLERGRAAKLFFSPTVIVFTCISCAEILLYILFAMSM